MALVKIWAAKRPGLQQTSTASKVLNHRCPEWLGHRRRLHVRATFLGMAGLISLNGFDGFLYPTGWMVAFVTVLLVVAEPCRELGAK